MVNLEVLATRSGFNAAVRHIKKTLSILDSLEEKNNLGDLRSELDDAELAGEQAALLLRMIVTDKWGYKTASSNLPTVREAPASLAGEFKRWKAVDLLAAYHHPDLGVLLANPKSAGELTRLGPMGKRELLVIYAGKGDVPGDDLCLCAARLAAALFEGGGPEIPGELYQGAFTAADQGSADLSPPPGGTAWITPRYSVAVGNELFHNGNVEAWKRIIASYRAAYPDLQVSIYYEGERIADINALFKWGKVKHGRSIQFAVAGRNIKDAAKLRRYLRQGASPYFEPFLQGPAGTTLPLF
ncbi:MAG: hypothetical protein LBD37_01710 [Treponema sp.]|jgi:hypothetical protein|nr:hypothetical protein [Treponema sp.]